MDNTRLMIRVTAGATDGAYRACGLKAACQSHGEHPRASFGTLAASPGNNMTELPRLGNVDIIKHLRLFDNLNPSQLRPHVLSAFLQLTIPRRCSLTLHSGARRQTRRLCLAWESYSARVALSTSLSAQPRPLTDRSSRLVCSGQGTTETVANELCSD
ncbi:hypothetical protein BC834DRAFT_9074 [Gloeopeniophorella convolvens]|nr:hypothetical protein BC834DRAFT_9074 [Gloeopeniophorella convolvens]